MLAFEPLLGWAHISLLLGSPSKPDPLIVAPVVPAQLSAYRRAAGLAPLAVALKSALLYSCFLTNGAPVIWLSLVGGNGLPEVVRALSSSRCEVPIASPSPNLYFSASLNSHTLAFTPLLPSSFPETNV